MNWIITAALLLLLSHAGDVDAAGPSVGGSAGTESGTQLRRDAEQRRALEARKSRTARESDSQSSGRTESRSRSLTRAASEKLDVTSRLSASALFVQSITEIEQSNNADNKIANRVARSCRLYSVRPMLVWLYTHAPLHPVARFSSAQEMGDCYLGYGVLQHLSLSNFSRRSQLRDSDGRVIVTDQNAARELMLSSILQVADDEFHKAFDRDAIHANGKAVSPVARVCVSPLQDGSRAFFCYTGAGSLGLVHGVPQFPDVITPTTYSHRWEHVIGSCEIDSMARTLRCAGIDYLGPRGSHGTEVTVQVVTDRSIQVALRADRVSNTETRVARDRSRETTTSASMSKSRATSRASTDSASSRSDSGVTVSPPN